jgi:hypothetical protein
VFLSTKAFCLLAGAIAILLAGGCGDDESASGTNGGGEVTVKTGSLSKAEFVERADRLCEETENRFRREYEAFVKASVQRGGSGDPEKMVKTILIPSFEGLIDEISSIGAPRDDEDEVAAFLDALQRRLDELGEQPSEILEAFSPFPEPVKLANAYGMTGCAESLD